MINLAHIPKTDSPEDINFCLYHCPFPNRKCNGKIENCKCGIAPKFKEQAEYPSKLQLEANRNKKMALYKKGLSDGQIADKLHISKSSVQQWRARNKLPPNYKMGVNVNRVGRKNTDTLPTGTDWRATT